MSKKIKPVVIDVLLSSTSHGIPNIIRAEKTSIKLMWTVFTIASSGLCAFMIVQSILNYLSFETTTKIRVLSETISEFPTVTICNLNFFSTEYSVEILKSANLSEDIDVFQYDRYYTALDYVMDPKFKSNLSKFGDSFEKLVVRCAFFFKDCKNESDWKYFYHKINGNCYQINSKVEKLRKVTKTGWYNGINLILNASLARGLEDLFPSFGIYVFIHNHTMSPYSVDPFTASVGKETNIALSRLFKKQIPKPYSNCDGDTTDPNSFDSKLYKLIHSQNIFYNQKLCIDLCFQDYVVKTCGCYHTTYPYFGDDKVEACYGKSDYECMNDCDQKFFEDPSFTDKICLPQCPLECESMSFTKFYSTNDYFNDRFNTKVNEYYNYTGSSMRNIREELLAVNIYYEVLSYTEITEKETIDFVGLLSNIGGVAGLFLGVSFLSFVELVEVLFQVVHVLIDKKEKTKVENIENK